MDEKELLAALKKLIEDAQKRGSNSDVMWYSLLYANAALKQEKKENLLPVDVGLFCGCVDCLNRKPL